MLSGSVFVVFYVLICYVCELCLLFLWINHIILSALFLDHTYVVACICYVFFFVCACFKALEQHNFLVCWLVSCIMWGSVDWLVMNECWLAVTFDWMVLISCKYWLVSCDLVKVMADKFLTCRIHSVVSPDL